MERRFPLFVSLEGRRVLIYGGGRIAARRTAVLVRFGADVTVIAPEIRPEILYLQGVTIEYDVFRADAVPAAALVLAATDDPAVNRAIAAVCRGRGIPVNSASDREDCDFHFPAVAVRGNLVAGVNAGGTDHGLVRRAAAAIRRLLEELE